MTFHDRFKDAPWYEGSKDDNILIAGVGGIGSNAAYSISKTIPARRIYLLDPDIVESYNIGTQFFNTLSITVNKAFGLSNTLKQFGVDNTFAINKFLGTEASAITISAFDNMAARKKLFENWKALPDKEILIDGRLRANLYEVYAVTPDRIEQYEATFFDDSEVDDDVCTFKQTAYFAVLIGARITHLLVNYLTNKYSEADICNLPFKVEEIGEPFFIKTE